MNTKNSRTDSSARYTEAIGTRVTPEVKAFLDQVPNKSTFIREAVEEKIERAQAADQVTAGVVS